MLIQACFPLKSGTRFYASRFKYSFGRTRNPNEHGNYWQALFSYRNNPTSYRAYGFRDK